MLDVGGEHVAVDDLRSSSKERDDEKIPPLALLWQNGEFEMGMRGKIETRAKDGNLVQAYPGHYLVFQCLNDQTEFSK